MDVLQKLTYNVESLWNSDVYKKLLSLYFKQHNGKQNVYHQISSFNHFINVEVAQTILRSCPVRITGSPDRNITGTTRAAAGTAGTGRTGMPDHIVTTYFCYLFCCI